jgi:hypothetical protein
VQTPRSPKAVVEEAGKGLGEKTHGTVTFYTQATSIHGTTVKVGFSLYAPALSYMFPFLRLEFDIQSIYPVVVITDKMDDAVAKDEKELTALLAKIFNAPSTAETIQRLMALATE